MNLNLFSRLKSSIQFFDQKPFRWRGMKAPLTYLESTQCYKQESKIGNQSFLAIKHEVKVYQRSNRVSKFIMDVVYQTRQKVHWLNYQQNKESFEKYVKEKLTDAEQQILNNTPQPEYTIMIESYLFPMHTSSNSNNHQKISQPSSNEASRQETKIVDDFAAWSLNLFKKQLSQLHKFYLEETYNVTENTLTTEKNFSKERAAAYQAKLEKLKRQYKRRLSSTVLSECLKKCQTIFYQHDKILNQNIELLIAFKQNQDIQATQAADELSNLNHNPDNKNTEVVVAVQKQAEPKPQTKQTASQISSTKIELHITDAMTDEIISNALLKYTTAIQIKANELYEKICLTLYEIYMSQFAFRNYFISLESRNRHKQQLITTLLEEVKTLFLNAYRTLHPDKLDVQLRNRGEVVQLYQESFNRIREFHLAFGDLTQITSNSELFFSDNKVKQLLQKNNKAIPPAFPKKSQKDSLDQLKQSFKAFKDAMDKAWEEHKKAMDAEDEKDRTMFAEIKAKLDAQERQSQAEKAEMEAKLDAQERQRQEEKAEMEAKLEEQQRKTENLRKQMELLFKMVQSKQESSQKTEVKKESATQVEDEKTTPRLSTARNSFYAENNNSTLPHDSVAGKGEKEEITTPTLATTVTTEQSMSSTSPSLTG